MMRSLREARVDRWIERELGEGLAPRRRARLHEVLRRDPRARARYDRAVEALRVLEGDVDVAPSELEVVGRWLAADREATAPVAVLDHARRWWPALLAGLTAALALLWIGSLTGGRALQPWSDDGWQARGPGRADGLALEALCGSETLEGAAPILRPRDCGLSDLMGLAYRVPADREGQLTVFGVDAQGDPMFYLPTPAEATGAAVEAGHWRALPLAVRLSVNHAAGPLRIYGLVAPSVATVDEVRSFAEQLAPLRSAEPGDPPWTARVEPRSLRRLCPEPSSCDAAELRLTLRPKARP